MSETGSIFDENEKDLIRNGQDPEDFIPEEEPESGRKKNGTMR